jgi:guanine nucleotide-binding protein G(I)/G(S)/G(T) subunit beta-1
MADMSAESIQQKIQIARRDAEALKDRIKRKKDELADTTRESAHGRGAPHPRPRPCRASLLTQWHSP